MALVQDDACLVLAEIVAHAKTTTMHRPAAQVLLQMANTPEARGKMVQQGGFKALLTLSGCDDHMARVAASWGLAKVGISINPSLYPNRIGSGPEGMVKPLVHLVDEGSENELMQFEASMTLCNLATLPDLRDRIVKEKGWRALEMAMTSQNELVQRGALECMSNLVTNEEIAEKFTRADSTATKVFVGFCGSDDPKAQLAASGGIATICHVPEIAEALLDANVLEPLVEIALIGTEPGLVHRAAVALARLLEAAPEKVVGKQGDANPPQHAVLALGALSSLVTNKKVPPAQKAAHDAIHDLLQSRPDVRLPPAELVAEAVAKLQAEHDARVAAAEEEERAAEEAAAAAAEAEAAKEARKAKADARRAAKADAVAAAAAGGDELAPVVEDGDDDDDDDDGMEVI